MAEVSELISYLLPHMITAGAYSAQVQGEVSAHEAKKGETIFHQALSDADLTIQAYFEVVLLARYPQLHFFSEEQDKSLNRKYFLGTSNLEVLLDPVDGTRPYIDGRESYQIIVAIHDEREMVGAICYLPRREKCFVAAKDKGAFVLSREEILSGKVGTPLKVSASQGPVLVFNSPSLVEKLSRSLDVKDLMVSYLEDPGRHSSTDLLDGLATAVVHETCQAIDGGALAFIAQEAGAIVSSFTGQPIGSFRARDSRTQSHVVVAATDQVYQKVLAALK